MFANATGQAILNQTVTQLTFVGPPLIVIADGLSSASDARWLAALDFATALGAPTARTVPMIGFDALEIYFDLNGARTALNRGIDGISRFFEPAALTHMRWCGASVDSPGGGSLVKTCRPTGPWLVMPSQPNLVLPHSVAWLLTDGALVWGSFFWAFGRYATSNNLYIRVTSNNLYGIGAFACGGATPEKITTAPVYRNVTPGVLKTLLNVWQRGGPVVVGSYAALQAEENNVTRKGISLRTHPALVPYIQLSAPT